MTKKMLWMVSGCLLAGVAFADVAGLQDLQASNENIAHHYTFDGSYEGTGGTGSWLDNNAVASPDLSQTLYEAARIADQQTGFDGSSRFANFDAWASGVKGDGLTSGSSSITFAASGTIEYLVQVGSMTNNGYGRFMVSGDGAGGSNDRFQFLVMYGDGVGEARMSLGANSPRVVFGGTTGVAYTEGDWYYVLQTWDFSSGSSVVMNAWVANLSAGDTTLTKTVDGAVNTFAGNGVAELDLGNFANLANYFADGGLDALAVYDAQLSESVINAHYAEVIASSGNEQSGGVTLLEQQQAQDASLVYHYTFEGEGDGERLSQKTSPYAPALEEYTNAGSFVDPVSFVSGNNEQGTAVQTSAGGISGGVRNAGSALKAVSNITYTASGTVEFLVKADLIDDQGYAIAGTGSATRWRFFANGAVGSGSALSSVGDNVPLTVIGGDTGVDYAAGRWYYVAQTWVVSGGNVTLNAWVSDLSASEPVLVQTISNQIHGHAGGFSSDFRVGSLGDALNYFEGQVDAVAVYDEVMTLPVINDHFQAVSSSVSDIGGIPVSWIVDYFGSTTGFSADTVGANGFTYGESYEADLNPTNENSVLKVLSVSLSGTDVTVEYQNGGSNASVYVEHLPPADTNWVKVATNEAPANTTNTAVHVNADASGWYRVSAQRL